MNLSNLFKALGNIKAHPWTTVAGALLATALALTNQPDAKHLGLAFLTALLGFLAQDPTKKA